MNPGLKLKNRREELGISVDQVAEYTKLKPRHIESIEAWNLKDLPTGAYLRGFLKNYCNFLSLNIDEFMQKSVFESKDINIDIPEIIIEESKPKAFYLIFSLIALIIIYLFWYFKF